MLGGWGRGGVCASLMVLAILTFTPMYSGYALLWHGMCGEEYSENNFIIRII